MNKLVSINIVTYNAQDLIEKCLESVFNQTYKNIEVLVIDNNSQDKTKGILGEIRGNRGFKIILNKKNLGYTGGHNVGIRECKGDYVLCLTQDVVLDKDFIKYAVEAMEEDIKIAAIQGKLFRKDKILDSTGLVMFKNRRVIDRGMGELDKGQYDGPSTSSGRELSAREIFGVNGAAPLYRREALEDIKIDNEYFDEDLFMYKEDIDLAWRLRLYAWKAIYQPEAFAYHLRGAGDKAVRDYVSVALARRKISKFAKFHSFKNDRLIRIKNELPGLFFRHIFYIIIKEMGAWGYVLVFEHYTWKAIRDLIKQIPNAWRKRKLIMTRKRVSIKDMKKWFK